MKLSSSHLFHVIYASFHWFIECKHGEYWSNASKTKSNAFVFPSRTLTINCCAISIVYILGRSAKGTKSRKPARNNVKFERIYCPFMPLENRVELVYFLFVTLIWTNWISNLFTQQNKWKPNKKWVFHKSLFTQKSTKSIQIHALWFAL